MARVAGNLAVGGLANLRSAPSLCRSGYISRCLLAAIFLLIFTTTAHSNSIVLENADKSLVSLTAAAERIVSLSPHLTELVFAAGAGSKLVGVVSWSDYPPAAKSVLRIGDAFRVDMELLLTLKPDLVISWQSGNSAIALDKITQLGIPVWQTEVSNLQEVWELMLEIGKAADTEPTAQLAAQSFRHSINQLKQQFHNRPAFRYFMQLYPKPLYTVNSQHLISQGLSLCHGENIFANLGTLAPTVSQEAVIAAKPVTIFYTNSAGNNSANDAIQQWTPWLGASKEPRMLALDPDLISRPGPRIIEGIKMACAAQHKLLGNSR